MVKKYKAVVDAQCARRARTHGLGFSWRDVLLLDAVVVWSFWFGSRVESESFSQKNVHRQMLRCPLLFCSRVLFLFNLFLAYFFFVTDC